MVSDHYRKVEDDTARAQSIHDDILEELEFKLNRNKPIIEQAIYRTCVTAGFRPIEVAHVLNEFHMHLRDVVRGPREEEKNG